MLVYMKSYNTSILFNKYTDIQGQTVLETTSSQGINKTSATNNKIAVKIFSENFSLTAIIDFIFHLPLDAAMDYKM